MPAHLRVSVPDRPGALAALANALSGVGTNVMSVAVVDREHGRAIDDLILDWPYGRSPDTLIDSVEGCRGTRVHGLRHVLTPAVTSDADLAMQLLHSPHRAVETVTDALPAVLLADWSAAFDRRDPMQIVYATSSAPAPLPPTTPAIDRAHSGNHGAEAFVVAELPGTVLRVMVGRANGPAFTRAEVDRCAALLNVTAATVRLAYDAPTATDPTEVTEHLLATTGAEQSA